MAVPGQPGLLARAMLSIKGSKETGEAILPVTLSFAADRVIASPTRATDYGDELDCVFIIDGKRVPRIAFVERTTYGADYDFRYQPDDVSLIANATKVELQIGTTEFIVPPAIRAHLATLAAKVQP
jgi:hypothetical protein